MLPLEKTIHTTVCSSHSLLCASDDTCTWRHVIITEHCGCEGTLQSRMWPICSSPRFLKGVKWQDCFPETQSFNKGGRGANKRRKLDISSAVPGPANLWSLLVIDKDLQEDLKAAVWALGTIAIRLRIHLQNCHDSLMHDVNNLIKETKKCSYRIFDHSVPSKRNVLSVTLTVTWLAS